MVCGLILILYTVKPVVSGHSKRRTKFGFKDRLSLNTGQKYCRMLQESILQYFRPALSYHLSLRPLFCLFLRGRLRRVLLYYICSKIFSLFLFLFSNKILVNRTGINKMLVRIANREDPDQTASEEAV